MIMRKTTLIFCMLLWSIPGKSQFPTIVNDPMNYGLLGEMLVQAEGQLEKVDKQLTFAEKAANRVEKVNDQIKTLKLVTECFERGRNTVERINRIYTTIKGFDGLSPEYISMCTKRCAQACAQIVGNMQFMETALGVGLKMSDKERLTTLQDNLDAINMEAVAIERLDRQAARLYEKRKLLKTF